MIFLANNNSKEIELPKDPTFDELERYSREVYQQGRTDEIKNRSFNMEKEDMYNSNIILRSDCFNAQGFEKGYQQALDDLLENYKDLMPYDEIFIASLRRQIKQLLKSCIE